MICTAQASGGILSQLESRNWGYWCTISTGSSKRKCIAVNGTQSHSYGVLLAIWDHTCHPTQVNTHRQTGQCSIYLPRTGWKAELT